MEFVPAGSFVRPPDMKVTQFDYWAPFHVEHGPADRITLNRQYRFAEIIGQLPPQFDGFTIGSCVVIETGEETTEVTQSTPTFYVPYDRCRLVSLSELSTKRPELFDYMVQNGLSAALETVNGHVAYDPATVQIVR